MMKITTALALILVLVSTAAWAAVDSISASVSATVASVCDVSLIRDDNSVARGSIAQIVFDKRDDVDMTGGNAGFMYAPYRSESVGNTGKNWHVAQIVANGSSSVVLSAAVSGSAGTKQLSDVMKVWCGGFFTPGATTPITGTATSTTTGWEWLNGWQRSLSRPFTGTVPFNYQLLIGELPGSTTPYTGSVTFTLTSN